MDVNGFTTRPFRMRFLLFCLSAALPAGLMSAPAAEAAADKRLALTPAQARTFVAWTNYLATGPATWSRRQAPAFTPAIRSTIWQVLRTDTQGQALANPMIDYLLWRRSLNPQRFLSNHPRLSPALAQLLTPPPSPPSLPSTVPIVPAPIYPSALPPKEVSPQTVTGPPAETIPGSLPPAVPEPGSWLLATVMTGVGLLWRNRLGRRRGE